MDADELKQLYGAEYPNALTSFGVRMPLKREGRFTRYFHSDEKNHGAVVSKFQDGSATITLEELQNEWNTWTNEDQVQFCGACSWLNEHPQFADMLRFIMKNGGPEHWSAIALAVGSFLPRDEAFQLLVQALSQISTHTANVTQGIQVTKHPDASDVLRKHLEILWKAPNLWEDDSFNNWAAFDATCCIEHLLQLGASPKEFEAKVKALWEHPCAGNRDSVRNFLHKFYDWLPTPDFKPFAT